MNRTQFWLQYLGAIVLYVIGLTIFDMIIGGRDTLFEVIAMVAMLVTQFRALYLRAIDIGYPRAGWMTAAVLIPLIGFFVLLNIGFLPTGSRPNKRRPIQLVPAE